MSPVGGMRWARGGRQCCEGPVIRDCKKVFLWTGSDRPRWELSAKWFMPRLVNTGRYGPIQVKLRSVLSVTFFFV